MIVVFGCLVLAASAVLACVTVFVHPLKFRRRLHVGLHFITRDLAVFVLIRVVEMTAHRVGHVNVVVAVRQIVMPYATGAPDDCVTVCRKAPPGYNP